MKARYRLKRRSFSLAGEATGGVLKTTGRTIKTLGTGLLGTVVGGAIGAGIDTLAPGVGSALTNLGIGGAGKTLLGMTAGKHLIQGAGNAIGKIGESVENY